VTVTPRPYQLVGRDFLASRRHALLADEMRVGKTPQAILAAAKIGANRPLVICPAIAVEHWRREFVKWWPAKQQPLFSPVIMSYDRAKMEAEVLLANRWPVTIVDECHYAKNPDAQRTKLIYGKNGLGWVSDKLWALSATPATKHAGELWAMLRAFGVTKLDYERFAQYYCDGYYDRGFRITGTKVSRIPELRHLLSKVMLRRTRREVAPEVPPIDFQFLEFTRDPSLDLSVPDGSPLETWLEQNQDFDREDRIAVASAKAHQLAEEIIFSLENDMLKQTVVFGWHREPLGILAQLLSAKSIKVEMLTGATPTAARTMIQDDFRAGKVQVIVANIAAAGTAIDLSAASHGYFLELDWVPGNNVQAANRLVSLQKAEGVTFDVVTWPGTTDDKVQRILLRRASELAKIYN
jgi:SWI/SNF-related matrix-associated actin-dependent regulator of chromatin subfamily A-like protein 1